MLFNNWNISGCVKFRMLDNKTSSFDVAGDIPEGWSWQLLYSCNGNLNIVDVEKTENGLSVLFTKEMLPIEGTYYFQLKGTKGELVKHTNIVKTHVNKSLSGDIKWPVIPTEFTQIEQVVKGYAESAKESETNAAESATKAENAAVHSPIVGENGNWFIWDFEKSVYVDTGKPSSTPPITPETAGKYLTNDGSKAEWVRIESDPSLGIAGATVGQIAKITAVDTEGKPTAWSPVDMAVGGEREWVEIGEITTTEDMTEKMVMEFAQDVHGNPLSLKGVLIIGKPLFNDANSHQCALFCKDNQHGGSANYLLYEKILRNKQTFTVYSEFLRADGINSVAVTAFNSGNVKQNGGCRTTVNTWSPTSTADRVFQFPMRGVSFMISDSGLLAGSNFKFWGVKA